VAPQEQQVKMQGLLQPQEQRQQATERAVLGTAAAGLSLLKQVAAALVVLMLAVKAIARRAAGRTGCGAGAH
jgi:hypothetical protein